VCLVHFCLHSGIFSYEKLKRSYKMWIFLVLVAILAVLIFQLIRSGRENYGVIEQGNIPVVPVSLFLGSEVNLHKEVQHLEDIKRFKKYGGVWGVRH